MNKDIYLIGEAYKNQILEASKKKPANNAPAGNFQVGDTVRIKGYNIVGTVLSLNNEEKAYPMVEIKTTKAPESGPRERIQIGSIFFYPADGVEKITPSKVTKKQGAGKAKPVYGFPTANDGYDREWHKNVEQGMKDEAGFDDAHPGSPWGRNTDRY